MVDETVSLPMMDKETLERFRKRLIQRRRELGEERETAETGQETVELDQARIGRLSRMDVLQAHAMSLEVKRRREIEIQRISSALGRIEDETFGYCLLCDEPIGPKRLETDPSLPLCVSCASRRERV